MTAIAEKLGVEFLYNAPVEKILVDGNRATGVALADGRTLSADIVVANADLGYVYRHLLPDDGDRRPHRPQGIRLLDGHVLLGPGQTISPTWAA